MNPGEIVLALLLIAVGLYMIVIPWHLRWGAGAEETRRAMPGDEMVASPKLKFTHAITVRRPADKVWPWIVQIGCGRAGWYSYDWLDNGRVPSTRRIIPEFQDLKVGDMVAAVPDGSFGFPVARIDPGRALVLGGKMNPFTGKDLIAGQDEAGPYFNAAWTIGVEPLDERSSRLFSRMNCDYRPFFPLGLFTHIALEPASFIMDRKMLLNLKERVEAQ